MKDLCDLKVQVNGKHTFLLNQMILSKFSGRLKKMTKQEKKKTQIKDSGLKITGFPGGPDGFELVSRFCYNNGKIPISPSNISLLHCSAIFLEMTEEMRNFNLLQQTEIFLEGLFYWTWNDILTALKPCQSFFSYADSSGLLEKLINSLLAKIAANSDITLTPSSSSSSSSPETAPGFRLSSFTRTPETIKSSSSSVWWFDDLTTLAPKIIEKVIKVMGAYGTDNNSLILTKFLLHYLKTALQRGTGSKSEYGGLADTAVNGVVSVGKTAFSCRGLFWVMRSVSGFGLSKDCRTQLEKLIGGMLDQATLDDLLVSGQDGAVYDVNLVLRLIGVFVSEEDGMPLQKMKKVGRLIDKYLREISPDQNLKVIKFLAVAESLPETARDCYDGVYRAIEIYLESHSTLTSDERTRLCRCLNYEKLTLDACKDLAKSPRVPPRVAIQALVSQQSKQHIRTSTVGSPNLVDPGMNTYYRSELDWSPDVLDEKEEMRLNLQSMQSRVMELEKVCKEMKGQMTKMVKNKVLNKPAHNRAMPRLC